MLASVDGSPASVPMPAQIATIHNMIALADKRLIKPGRTKGCRAKCGSAGSRTDVHWRANQRQPRLLARATSGNERGVISHRGNVPWWTGQSRNASWQSPWCGLLRRRHGYAGGLLAPANLGGCRLDAVRLERREAIEGDGGVRRRIGAATQNANPVSGLERQRQAIAASLV